MRPCLMKRTLSRVTPGGEDPSLGVHCLESFVIASCNFRGVVGPAGARYESACGSGLEPMTSPPVMGSNRQMVPTSPSAQGCTVSGAEAICVLTPGQSGCCEWDMVQCGGPSCCLNARCHWERSCTMY